jgi:two-component system osmolarity sensor histidine kinase EnvZ
MAFSLKPYLPRSLFGRAALILIAPVITLQFIVSVVFIQRHYDRVTEQLTSAVILDIKVVLRQIAVAETEAARLALALQINYQAVPDTAVARLDKRDLFDLAGRSIVATLHNALQGTVSVDVQTDDWQVRVIVQTDQGFVAFDISRARFSATNPHQLLVLMALTGLLMTVIAFMFLRNQLTPITRLAAVATAFGRGEHLPYTTRGATEVRAAGQAFLAMRARIERQIESRTLMLSGVSHDLRSPLTRLKLGLTLLPQDDETAALLGDISDMERLLEEFLAFARGDAMEDPVPCDPTEVLHLIVNNALRAGHAVKIGTLQTCPPVTMRPFAVRRALENLVGNALRFGKNVEVSLTATAESLRYIVEDDGPGIPEPDRAQALEPFQRLDAARNPNQGGGVGLGLAIATDIARSHGGALTLSHSARLGGLQAEFRIAR